MCYRAVPPRSGSWPFGEPIRLAVEPERRRRRLVDRRHEFCRAQSRQRSARYVWGMSCLSPTPRCRIGASARIGTSLPLTQMHVVGLTTLSVWAPSGASGRTAVRGLDGLTPDSLWIGSTAWEQLRIRRCPASPGPDAGLPRYFTCPATSVSQALMPTSSGNSCATGLSFTGLKYQMSTQIPLTSLPHGRCV